MPNIEVISVGRVKSDWIRKGIDHYSKLLSRYRKVGFTTVKAAPSSADVGESIEVESARIEEKMDTIGFNILLDTSGRTFSSKAFAEYLQKRESGGKQIRFLIGGAFGLSDAVKGRADMLMSLSGFTLPHELSMVVLLEQLYRAYSILAGTKYHK